MHALVQSISDVFPILIRRCASPVCLAAANIWSAGSPGQRPQVHGRTTLAIKEKYPDSCVLACATALSLCCTELHHSITPPQKGMQIKQGPAPRGSAKTRPCIYTQPTSGAVQDKGLRSLPRSLHCGEKQRKELKKNCEPETETR